MYNLWLSCVSLLLLSLTHSDMDISELESEPRIHRTRRCAHHVRSLILLPLILDLSDRHCFSYDSNTASIPKRWRKWKTISVSISLRANEVELIRGWLCEILYRLLQLTTLLTFSLEIISLASYLQAYHHQQHHHHQGVSLRIIVILSMIRCNYYWKRRRERRIRAG